MLDSRTRLRRHGVPGAGGRGGSARRGDRDEIAARVLEAREQLKIWFAIDTLEFLRRGGRVGAAQAWLGSTLKIKPILTLEEQITPIERVRTAGRAFERLCEFLEERRENGADAWIVQHVQAREGAERLVERGREIFESDPLLVSEVGPVIGTHVGPGLLGVGGVPSSLLSQLPRDESCADSGGIFRLTRRNLPSNLPSSLPGRHVGQGSMAGRFRGSTASTQAKGYRMGIIELTLLIGAVWCLILAFGTALFAVAARADHREDSIRGATMPMPVAEVAEPQPVAHRSPVVTA